MSLGGTSETTTTLGEAERFPIVGVGASAGGLAATTELLRHLGSEPGVAMVIVHHLDPSHESSLVDIFSRVTSLPIHAATDGLVVLPNHVYVVPPNAGLRLANGILYVTPRIDTGGLHLPIDQFFESLATDRTVHAVGVVLTGSGSDGAEGVRAIKAEGGITFAQDVSAEYRSMPDAAIATGCVDFVLAPEGIARELIRIAEHTPPITTTMDDGPEFQRVVSALRKASGIDFANYKHSTIRRRVARRVLVHGLRTLREYADLLERNPDEVAALTEEALIHVTGFFRDPDTFEALKSAVLPKLLENRPRDAPIRVWVPGCSTGEEVYSIAISLLEFLGDANATEIPVKLFGTDVSLRAIEKARAARYPVSIEREVSPGRLQRFFSKDEGGYQIRKDVRDHCVFARQDATRDPPFSGLDLISCRNLMIYLGSALQERILPVFHYALKEPGFLVLGTSETVRSFPGFSTFDAKNKIYARTSATPRIVFDFSEGRLGEPPAEAYAVAVTKPSGPLEVHREADRLVMAEFAPPGVVVTDDLAIVQFRGKTGPFLEPAPGVASFDLLRMLREELRIPVRQTIDEARAKLQTARRSGVPVTAGGSLRVVDLEVIPFRAASTPQRFFVVLFNDVTPKELVSANGKARPPPEVTQSSIETQLAQELASTRDYLQAVIEQLEASNEELKAANEEIVSSNEELRSTNEELQMAKEELQATNEELRTVNDEMIVRNAEGTRLNDDLTNVLSSVEIPTIILGRDSRLRRFTPAAARAFRLGAADVGRPIGEVGSKAHAAELARMIASVLEQLTPAERTVQDEGGRWYQLTVRPYLTLDNRIDGTVITAYDIDTVKRGEQLLLEARKYAEGIVDTVRECLVVLDGELRVRSANRAFYDTFRTTPREIEKRPLHEIGHGSWNLPELQKRLRELDEGDALEGFRVEQNFSDAGHRIFMLNARRIAHTSSLLLALEDVTEREHLLAALQRTETGYREMLMTAAEAIFMTDGSGRIAFANEMASRYFGYSAEELAGLSVDQLVPEGLRELHAHHRAEYVAAPFPRSMGRDRNLVGRRKDGSEFPLEVILGSMTGASGPLVVSFVTDISRRRESEKKIRDYQARLQRMAFDAAVGEERERRRIAVDLHDRIGQSLALAQIKLTNVRDSVTGATRDAIREAVELLSQSVNDTRTLTFELSPPVLYDLGLREALAWLVEEVEKQQRLHVEIVDDAADKPLDDATAALVFRAVRELLMNVSKHAKADTAKVSLRSDEGHVTVEVADEGVGFDATDLAPRPGSGGFGLFSVREQINRLGGTVDIVSAPEQGTRVTIRVPVKGRKNHEDTPRG